MKWFESEDRHGLQGQPWSAGRLVFNTVKSCIYIIKRTRRGRTEQKPADADCFHSIAGKNKTNDYEYAPVPLAACRCVILPLSQIFRWMALCHGPF